LIFSCRETLENGTIIIVSAFFFLNRFQLKCWQIGGCDNGGYVNDAGQSNPTYEFFPSTGPPIASPILENTLPTNLYPLTWLLPSGNLLIQSNWDTVILDYKMNVETPVDNIPSAVRTYPASAGTAMLPLTPANNWTATIMFCGGVNLQPSQCAPSSHDLTVIDVGCRWNTNWDIATNPTSTSCVQITPDYSTSYVHVDPLPLGRSMANFILLPTGNIFCLNGANLGTAGYGNTSWAIGESFADSPVYTPLLYDPNAPAGSRWSNESLSASTVPRMYHSSALLLPDGDYSSFPPAVT
jgi:hypothetical protein